MSELIEKVDAPIGDFISSGAGRPASPETLELIRVLSEMNASGRMMARFLTHDFGHDSTAKLASAVRSAARSLKIRVLVHTYDGGVEVKITKG